MGKSLNKVQLIGHLGQDPDLKHTQSGTAVCNMRLATNEGYKDKDGEWQDRTEWHTITAWSRLAEICDEYLRKGSLVYFEGSLQTRTWEDRDGNTRYSTEVVARNMLMLDGKQDGESKSRSSKSSKRTKKAEPAEGQEDFDFSEPDDSYPF